MIAEIRKCAESHDIKGLRYIFADCLDVDPTFEKYREDYEYCKSIPGMFDDYRELTGISTDDSKWTTQYWDQLKLDLMKNFSQKRFEHMINVAKVVYADKIVRLLRERGSHQSASDKNSKKAGMATADSDKKELKMGVMASQGSGADLLLDDELQAARLAKKRREIEESNHKIIREQEAQNARIEAAKRESENRQAERNSIIESKKAVGIVLTVIIIMAVVLIILVLQ